jgi:hypothetical protein
MDSPSFEDFEGHRPYLAGDAPAQSRGAARCHGPEGASTAK